MLISLHSVIQNAMRRNRAALNRLMRGHRHAVTGDIFGMTSRERRRLEQLPRFSHVKTPLLGRSIQITDPYWYVFMYREIMVEGAYVFRCEKKAPLIIDCGSNIGLSVIYLKYFYPDARIIAFEPDPNLFLVLQSNIATFEMSDVQLYNRAVWTTTATLGFRSDGAVGGRLCMSDLASANTQVQTERLRDYLDQEIDFLKLDIEGAEIEVLQDCCGKLENVERLFVEYHGKVHVPQQLDTLLLILRHSGFRYHIKEANPVQHPFFPEERNRTYDLQLNVYAYRD